MILRSRDMPVEPRLKLELNRGHKREENRVLLHLAHECPRYRYDPAAFQLQVMATAGRRGP